MQARFEDAGTGRASPTRWDADTWLSQASRGIARPSLSPEKVGRTISSLSVTTTGAGLSYPPTGLTGPLGISRGDYRHGRVSGE